MGVIFPASGDGVVVTIPTGSHTGAILVNKADVTYRGQGRDLTTIVSDLTYGYTILSTAGVGGTITLEDMEIDAGNLALSSVVSADGAHFVLNRCRIRNHNSSSYAIFASSRTTLNDVQVIGNGVAYQVHSTVATAGSVSNLQVYGGRAGIVVTDGGLYGQIPVGDISNSYIDLGYQHNPLGERDLTPTAVSQYGVEVETNDTGSRSLYDVVVYRKRIEAFTNASFPSGQSISQASDVREGDLLVGSAGQWSRVLSRSGSLVLDRWRRAGTWDPTSDFTGDATLFRPHLLRLYGATATELHARIGSTPHAGWRFPNGDSAGTPTLSAGSKVDVYRHALTAGQTRDVDTGGIHVPYSGRDSVISDTQVLNTFSDGITVRGRNVVSRRCSSRSGQDQGWTVDCSYYEQTLEDCVAERSGYNGFTVIGGFARLTNCTGSLNGTHYVSANPVATAGCGYTMDASGSRSAIRGFGGTGNSGDLGSSPSGSYAPDRPSMAAGALSLSPTPSIRIPISRARWS